MRRNVINMYYTENGEHRHCCTSVLFGDINHVIKSIQGNIHEIKAMILKSFIYPVSFTDEKLSYNENSTEDLSDILVGFLSRKSYEDTVYVINLIDKNIVVETEHGSSNYISFDPRFTINNKITINKHSIYMYAYSNNIYCSLLKSSVLSIESK